MGRRIVRPRRSVFISGSCQWERVAGICFGSIRRVIFLRMISGRFAIIDPASGISGDMVLGALVAVGAPAEWLTGLPSRLGLRGVSVGLEPVRRCGIMSVKVTVRLPGGKSEEPNEAFVPPHSHEEASPHDSTRHTHHHHGADQSDGHRHIGELITAIEQAPLSAWVKERATRAFRLLAEAEGRVHGVPAEQVALHEVGAVDALLDVVGAIEGFEQLGITHVYHRPVAVGSGWVRAAHGVIPVPAPVTALLLEGLELGPNGPVTGEATTPTGAALLRVLSSGAPPDHWRAAVSGWGAGTRNPPDYPNALRLLLADTVPEAGEIVTLVTDLDDLSPEYLDPLREALLATGALDVALWTTQTKKGRTGFRIEVLAPPEREHEVIETLFVHSTTAGVRRARMERITLPRRMVEVQAPDGATVHVKVLDTPGGPRVKAEYEEIAALARRSGRPAHELAREVQTRALELLAGAGPNPDNRNKEK